MAGLQAKSKYSLQVLSPGLPDAPPCVLVRFETRWYMFNCGEGTQRLCSEHKVRLANRCHAIFATRAHWDALGGLPGMLLTLADAGAGGMALYGPPGVAGILAATRSFVQRRDFGVSVAEWDFPGVGGSQAVAIESGTAFKDDNMSVKPVLLFAPPDCDETQGKEPPQKRARTPPEATPQMYLQRMFSTEIPRDLAASTFLTRAADGSEASRPAPTAAGIVYVCRGADMRGTFLVSKARALGLAPGPQFAQLARGETVMAPDGTSVTPEMVLGPPQPGTVWLIADVPTAAAAAALDATDPVWAPFISGGPLSKHVRVCIHMLGPGIAQDPAFVKWKSAFGPTVEHVVLGGNSASEPAPIVFQAHATLMCSLQRAGETEFPLPVGSDGSEGVASDLLVEIPLAPGPKDSASRTNPLAPLDYAALRAAHEPVALPEELEVTPEPAQPMPPLAIVPLGTGSAIPSKARNVSSTLVLEMPRLEPRGPLEHAETAILLDCGEGTYGQLVRAVGPAGAQTLLSRLRLIIVSHLHADHHLGLIRLLQHRSASCPPVHVVAPRALFTFLCEYAAASAGDGELLEKIVRVDADDADACVAAAKTLGLKRLDFVPVDHCPSAFACVLGRDSANGGPWTVAYSGDCRPSDALAAAARDCDVLIHEATFDDALASEAIAKKHCTVSEALAVGASARARVLLLMHFSQRYPQMPPQLRAQRDAPDAPVTVPAFDLMRFYLADAPKWRRLVPILDALLEAGE